MKYIFSLRNVKVHLAINNIIIVYQYPHVQ